VVLVQMVLVLVLVLALRLLLVLVLLLHLLPALPPGFLAIEQTCLKVLRYKLFSYCVVCVCVGMWARIYERRNHEQVLVQQQSTE
jgi:hypothetical protein